MTDDITGARLVALSEWIDAASENRNTGLAQMWARVAKVAEESGEVIAALIGATGQNPRKGFTHSLQDVQKELLDVAVTALCAVEYLNGNGGVSGDLLREHVRILSERAGIEGDVKIQ